MYYLENFVMIKHKSNYIIIIIKNLKIMKLVLSTLFQFYINKIIIIMGID